MERIVISILIKIVVSHLLRVAVEGKFKIVQYHSVAFGGEKLKRKIVDFNYLSNRTQWRKLYCERKFLLTSTRLCRVVNEMERIATICWLCDEISHP